MRCQTACLALALALSACASGPDYAPPAAPGSKALAAGAFLRAGDTNAAAPLARWWEGLGDAQLDGLVVKGLAEAPTLAAAEARLRAARAGLAATRSSLLPSAGASLL